MRNKQIEKVSQRLFIVTSVLAVLFGLSIYQRSYQSVQPYGRWLKVLLIIVNLGALFSILRLFIHLLV